MAEKVHVFTENRAQYADLFEAVDDWQDRFVKAMGMGIAPQVLSAPVFVLWEITGKCPQNCVYCYNESPKKVEELSPQRLFQVADQLIEAKVFSICLSGGEPTMRQEYFDLLEYLTAAGIQVGTVLSGWRIDEKAARHIARFTSTVQISLDGSTSKIHDAIRRRRGSYDDAVQAIKHFVHLGVPVNVAMVITKDNVEDFTNVYRLCEELGVASLRTQKLAVSGKAKGHQEICAGDAAQERLKQSFETLNGNKVEISYGDPTTHITFGRQFGLSVIARVTAEGYVGISPYLDIFFGGLKTEDLSDIWMRMRKGWHHPKVKDLLETQVQCQDGRIVDSMPEAVFVS